MTTSTLPKVTPSKDMPNTSLVQGFKDALAPVIEKEKSLWLEMVGLMRADSLSVRGGKSTIEAVEAESGTLPTLATSAVQYFLSAGVVHDTVQGAKDATLFALINTTIQGTRKLGAKRFAELVSVTPNFKKLADTVEKAPAKEKAEGKAKPEGVDALIVALAEALEAEGFEGIVRDPEIAEAVAKQLSACAKHSKALNHPAGKALVA